MGLLEIHITETKADSNQNTVKPTLPVRCAASLSLTHAHNQTRTMFCLGETEDVATMTIIIANHNILAIFTEFTDASMLPKTMLA